MMEQSITLHLAGVARSGPQLPGGARIR